MRDEKFIMDNEKFLFAGSFDFTGANMAVSDNVREYLNKTVHTKNSRVLYAGFKRNLSPCFFACSIVRLSS